MTPKTSVAIDAAGRLWARTTEGASAPGALGTAADLMCTQLRKELGRWIGAGGYRALLERALAEARAEHPVLEELSCLGADAAAVEESVRTRGGEALSAGLVAWVGGLIELLGRIIGTDMAVQLVDRIDPPSPHGVASIRPRGGRDGE